MEENDNINNQKYDILHSTRNATNKFSMRISVMSCFLITIILVFSTCTRQGKYDESLDKADSLINTNPDSALAILDSIVPYEKALSCDNLRRWQLLRLTAQNKCDTVFHSDSLQLELVKYYDSHGTPNERMTAHYLLGRAYSDMGESPHALQCYQDAVACADTTSQECDYNILFRVYGQIAFIYEAQHLYEEEIDSWDKFSHFASKAGDVYCYIKGLEYKVVPYYAMNDTAACFRMTHKVQNLYMENGYEEKAAGVYYTVIMILLDDGQYNQAHELMRIYEEKSGFFDKNGNIKPGMEHYYYAKGLYFKGVHQTDSAEFFFRKLQCYHVNNNYEAYKGLLSVCLERRDIDSVAKYAILCEAALDSIQAMDQSDAVAITHSLYNYNRMGVIANQKTLESQKRKTWIWMLAMIILMVTILGVSIFLRQKRKKEEELGRMSSEHMAAVHKYKSLEHELQILEQDHHSVIEDKKREIEKLSEIIEEYKARFASLPNEKCEAAMQNADIVLSFREKAKAKRGGTLPTPSDWGLLKALLQENLPHFYDKIILNGGLSEQELQICLLCRLDFHTGEIAVLLDTLSQRITNAKISANLKLFGVKKAFSLKDNLRRI